MIEVEGNMENGKMRVNAAFLSYQAEIAEK
jgi:hypothetical protein